MEQNSREADAEIFLLQQEASAAGLARGWILIAEVWMWLGENSTAIGSLSSISFGLSSALVAWTALRLSYRNNFGPKPLVLVTSVGGARSKDGDVEYATFRCE